MRKNRRSPIIRSCVETGVKSFDRYSVANVEYSSVAFDLVKACVEECNYREEHTPAVPHELVLGDNVDLVKAVLWMGKAVVSNYGPDFVMIETTKSSVSNRATDQAAATLGSLKRSGSLGFAFFVEQDNYLSDIFQEERTERLRENLGSLAVPTMNILTTMPVETGVDPGEPAVDRLDIVMPQFTINTRLEYPLILMSTTEPS